MAVGSPLVKCFGLLEQSVGTRAVGREGWWWGVGCGRCVGDLGAADGLSALISLQMTVWQKGGECLIPCTGKQLCVFLLETEIMVVGE